MWVSCEVKSLWYTVVGVIRAKIEGLAHVIYNIGSDRSMCFSFYLVSKFHTFIF
jgi:hypothetical protein